MAAALSSAALRAAKSSMAARVSRRLSAVPTASPLSGDFAGTPGSFSCRALLLSSIGDAGYVSQIEKITGELRALMTGVERAQGLAAAADSQAQEVALRAAGAGFVAVAAGVARVRNAITSIQSGLRSLASSIGEATKATAAVPNEATAQETIAGLAPVQSAVDAARDAAAGAITGVGEAQQLVVMVLQGGQPGPLLQALDSIKQVLVLVVARTGGARQAIEAAIAEARQLGSSGN
ncbi:hypothetical protein Xph01_47920 [Micromonospora phaseoli]|nr:hypothetical protein Xph01_47920 [Micromonospora phaseoli]